ncbi:MAG TPA: hypothetical protein VMW43_07370, partial [Bacteroidota bacterium]|nr:hypothetical protein [Bacteroidota bacterium]
MFPLIPVLVLLFLSPARTQIIQQGNKLVGAGAAGKARQGSCVALSGDGTTAIVGGWGDNGDSGAAWIWTRTNDTWTQQAKLSGTGSAGIAHEGASVAISADGATAIIGGPNDSSGVGAVWIFTRAGGVWTQEGGKLVGTGTAGQSELGSSVAVSADGNTAIASGANDSGLIGAVWVFTRNAGIWAQQGDKLVGTDLSGQSELGRAVAISGDGNTFIVGGMGDGYGTGAAWIFTRSGSVWSQEGGKLVGTGADGNAFQGSSVSLAADGNTAIVGGVGDSSSLGAAWVFTRSGGVWMQQGEKLVGTGAVGGADQGTAVALSGNGSTALVGGDRDNSVLLNSIGASWVFTRSGGAWHQKGDKITGN